MPASGLPDWPWTRISADDLPRPEALLLDAMRVARSAALPVHAASLVLAAEDAAAAAIPLAALLRCAAIEIRPRLCPCVGDGEAALIQGCALAQRGLRSEALATFLRILPLQEAYAAMPPAIHLGIAFRRAGLLLRHPFRPMARPSRLARG